MLTAILFVISIIGKAVSLELYLFVVENTKPSNPIGNLAIMVRNQTKSAPNLEFKSFDYKNINSENMGTKAYIKIDPKNGDIMLQSPIDREYICYPVRNCAGRVVLNYFVYIDQSFFDLKIEITDVNDNSPSFYPDNKLIEIPEGIPKLTRYSLPVAEDRDSKQFSVTSYKLKADEKYFQLSIDAHTNQLWLVVVGELDRESCDHFKLDLFAIDGGGNRGMCKITVRITDINDNTPQWTGLPYRQQIRECTTDNKVKQLMAIDRDDKLTAGGQIQFKINDNGQNELIAGTFHVTDDVLYCNVGMLRTLGQSKLSVSVSAIDGGGRRNETTVEVNILDCNDHAPLIVIDKPMPSVMENDQNVQFLTQITVSDKDYDENSVFHCHINDTSHVTLITQFHRNANESHNRLTVFKLQTIANTGFDREKIPRHIVEIICTDNGSPMLTSTGVVTIFIADQNDNQPHFDLELYVFSVSEDASIRADIGRVEATDNDLSPNNIISYSIIGDANTRETFAVTGTGHIQLSRTIDREQIDKYEFQIVATDSGKPALNDSCQIKIIVLDVNDCKPEIAAEHQFTIVESNRQDSIHKNLGKLNATDRDKGYNGSVTFKLKPTEHHSANMIRVLADGRLTIYGIIDREISERITAEILVSDGGVPTHISTTTVIVEVLDLNDNKPKFVFHNAQYDNFINVSYDLVLGSVVGHVKAVDPDKDCNGTVDYAIIHNEQHTKTFAIHQDGRITLNEKLERNGRYVNRLTIEAKDGGTPPMVETTAIYVRYLMPKNKELDTKRNGVYSGRREKQNEFNLQKDGLIGWSNVMLIYLLAAAVFLIVLGIGGTFLYLWCRGHWFCPMVETGKTGSSSRELNSAGYPKNSSKSENSQSILDINNQFRTVRNDTSYQMVDPQCQVIHYPSLMNNYSGGAQIDPQYQFRSLMHTGNYSDFHPMLASPINDKDIHEFNPFVNDSIMWDNVTQMSTMDLRTGSGNPDYDNHKYNVIVSTNFNDSHSGTPGECRRAELIQPKNDPTYRAKIKYVASSFV